MKKIGLLSVALVACIGITIGLFVYTRDTKIEIKPEREQTTTSTVVKQQTASKAKTTMRNAITTIKAKQTGDGTVNFSTIDVESLQAEDPDLVWTDGYLDSEVAGEVTVSLLRHSDEEIVLLVREVQRPICYYTKLNAATGMQFGSAVVTENQPCPATPGIGGGSPYVDNQTGWDVQL